MKKVLAFIIALVIGFVGGFVVCKSTDEEYPDKNFDLELLKEEVANISELATLQETYTLNVPYTSESKKLWRTNIKIPFSEKSMVVEYNATLKFGLKLTGDNYDIKADGDTITVTVPHSQILSHEIDEKSWVLKDKKNGLFNPLKPEDDSALRKYAKKNALKKLDLDKLYSEADANAQEQIEKFLSLSCPDADIVVEFK